MIVDRWKDVKGYEGLYKVSDTGTVRSFKRKTPVDLIPNGDHEIYTLYKKGESPYTVTRKSLINAHFFDGNLQKQIRSRLPYVTIDSSVKKVIDIVCKKYFLDPDDIQSISSLRIIGDPRKLIHYICVKSPDIKLPFNSIAQMVGGKNRTTIYNSVTKTINLLDTSKSFLQKYIEIKSELKEIGITINDNYERKN